MKLYKKLFFVDEDDRENPRALFATVSESFEPKGKGAFFELNGVMYDVLGKSKWFIGSLTNEEGWRYKEIYVKKRNK